MLASAQLETTLRSVVCSAFQWPTSSETQQRGTSSVLSGVLKRLYASQELEFLAIIRIRIS